MTLHYSRFLAHGRALDPGISSPPSGEAERMVLMGFRHWLQGPDGWGDIVELYAAAGGPVAGGMALRGLKGLIEILNGHARRTLFLRPLGCPGRSADELWLISVVSAAQARHDNLLTLALPWLLPMRARPLARKHVTDLADGLAAMGLRLPLPGSWATDTDRVWHCANCPGQSADPIGTDRFPIPVD